MTARVLAGCPAFVPLQGRRGDRLGGEISGE